MSTFRAAVDRLAEGQLNEANLFEIIKIVGNIIGLIRQLVDIGKGMSGNASISNLVGRAEMAQSVFANFEAELQKIHDMK
jgi:hypothetical protein